MTFYKLDRLINLVDGYQKCFVIQGYSLLLVHQNGQSHLFNNLCPHQQQKLGERSLHNQRIRCPWHGLEYDLSTGRCVTAHQTQLKLTKYQLAYEGSYIGIYFQ